MLAAYSLKYRVLQLLLLLFFFSTLLIQYYSTAVLSLFDATELCAGVLATLE